MKQNYVYAHDEHPDVEYKLGTLCWSSTHQGRKVEQLLSRYHGLYRVIRKVTNVNYVVETRGKRRRASFVTHVSKMKPFRDRNEMFVDTDDEEDEGCQPVARRKHDDTTRPQDCTRALGNGVKATGEVDDELPPPDASEDESFASAADETAAAVTAAGGNTDLTESAALQGAGTSTSADGEDFVNLGPEDVVPLRRSQRSTRGIPATRCVDEMAHKQLAGGSSPGPKKSTLQNLIHFFLAVTMLIALTGGVTGLDVKACDCTSPQYAGVLDFGRMLQCPAQFGKLQYVPVVYDLFVEQGDGKTFSGQACRVWEMVKMVNEGILWNTDTTLHDKHEEIAPADCWPMVQNGNCGDQALKKTGNDWSFHADPVGEGSWNSISTFTTLNCEVVEITLGQDCDTCPVITLTGEVGSDRKLG